MAVYQEVTYEWNQKALDRLVKRRIGHVSAGGMSTSLLAVAAALFGLGVSTYLVWQVGSLTMRITITVLLVLVAALLIPLFPILFGSPFRSKSREFPARPVTMRLTDDGIELVDKSSSALTRWSAITGITEDKWGIYFEPGIMTFVPKSTFSTASAAADFVECARRLRRENAGQAPEVFRSELPALAVSYALDIDDLQERLNTSGGDKKLAGKMAGYQRVSKVGDVLYIFVIGGFFLWNVWRESIIYNRVHSLISFETSAVTALFLAHALYGLFTGRSNKRLQSDLFRGLNPPGMPMQSVRIDERGVTLGYEGMESLMPWTTFASIDLGPRLVRFQPVTGPAAINVRRSAFSTEDDLTYFVDIATAYVDSARTGAPPVFPESPSWPPPPSG